MKSMFLLQENQSRHPFPYPTGITCSQMIRRIIDQEENREKPRAWKGGQSSVKSENGKNVYFL